MRVGGTLRGDSTAERIKAAAVQLFAQKGFEATAIREIADVAQVSTSSLYHYIDNKDELLTEIMTTAMLRLIKCSLAMVDPSGTAPERLVALVRCHVGMQIIDRLPALVTDNEIRALRGEARERVIRLRDEYEDGWTMTLTDGKEQGCFDVAVPKVARLALLEMCNGVARWYQDDGPMQISDICDQFATLALSMVNAQRDGRPLKVADVAQEGPSAFYARLLRLAQSEVAE